MTFVLVRCVVASAAAFLALASSSMASSASLSPETWPSSDRLREETIEGQGWWSPSVAHTFNAKGGLVSASASPVAVYAGVQTLRAGGNAADAAVTTALTEVTMELGSVVSYAGIFTLLYYDAGQHRVFSLNAGYNSYLGETDPATIPRSDLGILVAGDHSQPQGGAFGRQTLVPGFMAGAEALHTRFGRLPFSDLFAPAIWYARHGVRISPMLQALFAFRGKELARTPEGRRFLHQGGSDLPKQGDLFVQTDLAETLTAISRQGSRYLYEGKWATDFVKAVQAAGGKVTSEDLARYWPTWAEPRSEEVFGHRIFANGAPHLGAYPVFAGLNLAEGLHLERRGPYWTDPLAFQSLTRISLIADRAPAIGRQTSLLLAENGIDFSPDAQLDKKYARAVAPLLDRIFTPPADSGPKHSNAIAVIDRDGNIAVVTHTINAIAWGDSGIVVDGIPVPDSAGFQQLALAVIKPGDRLPDPIIDTLAFRNDRPVLATASIGTSLAIETVRTLLGVLGQHQPLEAMMAAPPLLTLNNLGAFERRLSEAATPLAGTGYGAAFRASLNKLPLKLDEKTAGETATLRGTLAALTIDPLTGGRTAVEQPGVGIFVGSE